MYSSGLVRGLCTTSGVLRSMYSDLDLGLTEGPKCIVSDCILLVLFLINFPFHLGLRQSLGDRVSLLVKRLDIEGVRSKRLDGPLRYATQ